MRVVFYPSNNYIPQKTKAPSFGGIECSAQNFVLKKLERIPCACCGYEMISRNEATVFIKKVALSRGEELVDVLSSYLRVLKPLEETTVQALIEIASDHPNRDLRELVKLFADKHKPILEQRQIGILRKIREAAQILPPKPFNELNAFILKSVELIRKSDEKTFFTRHECAEGIYSIIKKEGFSKIRDKVRILTEELPSSTNSLVSFMVKYARKTPKEIAQMLISPSISTTEHVTPTFLGGINNTSNYLLECGACNSSRNHKSLYSWIKLHPEMVRNTQRYIEKITKAILNGEVEGFSNYPNEIRETLLRESEGIIRLRVLDAEIIDRSRVIIDKSSQTKKKKPKA